MKPPTPPHFTQRDLFGGTGDVHIWNLLGNRAAPPFEAVLACELEPGGSVGTHVQQTAHELVIITSGEGEAEVEGKTHSLIEGSVVFLAHGHRLALKNTSTEIPLRYLIVKAVENG